MKQTLQNFKASRYKKKVLVGLSILFLVIFGGIVFAFLKRDAILDSLVERAISKVKTQYNLNVKIGKYGFSGLSSVKMSKISVVPQDRDTLAFIHELNVGVKLFPLIFGEIKLAELQMRRGALTLVKKDSLSNYDFLFKKDTTSRAPAKEVDYADVANKLLRRVLDKIPAEMRIDQFLVTYDQDTSHFKVFTETAEIDDGEVRSKMILNDGEAIWHVSGEARPSDAYLNLKLFADNHKVEFPFLKNKYGLTLSFDTVQTIMKDARKSGGEFEIEGSWMVRNLLINHPKIAANDVVIPKGSIDAKMVIGENFISIDSSSTVHLQQATLSPYIKISLKPHRIYEMKLRAQEQNAQDIFEAFPKGLFESLEGMKVAGKLQYALDFKLDSKKPDDVVFSSSLRGNKNFKILKFGQIDFRKINNTFVYTPYENGKPMRDILVGQGNPNFVPLNQISPNLKNALLTSEDPSFFSHHGFVEESIRQSIVTNFKAKSFKRGGSTISMQLVKNVYLNRQKTLARKIEEMLIVWLIENEQLSTKSRMYEVYLNIIEWGRNVYGIGEAARYYFGKHPSELSLGEGIYLASIVPKPKASLYKWQADGTLKPYLHGYFNLIGRLMASRGYTARDSSAYGFYGVRLKESLRLQIAPDSVAAADSLSDDDMSDLFEFFKIKKDSVTSKSAFLMKVFGKDTTEKTAKELRQERRELRRKEREQ